MAFCSKCGNQLQEGAKFCVKCGEPQVTATPTDNGKVSKAVKAPSGSDSKPKKKKKAIFVLALIVVAIIVVAVVGGLLKKQLKTLSLQEYYVPKYEGYNTVGRFAGWEVEDKAGIARKIRSINKGISDDEIEDIIYSLNVSLEKENDIAIGDVIRVDVSTDEPALLEENSIRLDTAGWEVTVAEGDLEPTTVIDPFSENYMQVKQKGISPFTEISIESLNAGGDIGKLSFSADRYENLKDGDIIHITLNTDPQNLLVRGGYIVENTEIDYTLAVENKYIDDVADISESCLARMQKEVTDRIETKMSHLENMNYSDMKYEGVMLRMKKTYDTKKVCLVYPIYSVKVTDPSEKPSYEPTTLYYTVEIKDLIEDKEGIQTYSADSYQLLGSQSTDINTVNKSRFTIDSKGFVDPHVLYNECVQQYLDQYDVSMTDSLKALFN